MSSGSYNICKIGVKMRTIISFIVKHETLMGSIIGAFLAAFFGIITQVWLDKKEKKQKLKILLN